MGAMNRRMNLPAVAKIMREFEKQNERMEMTSEMMGDAGALRPLRLFGQEAVPHSWPCAA